jgi:hypothetical protein
VSRAISLRPERALAAQLHETSTLLSPGLSSQSSCQPPRSRPEASDNAPMKSASVVFEYA